MSRQIKAAAFAAVLALAVVGSMAQVSIQRGWQAVSSIGLSFVNGTVLSDSASGKLLVTGTTPMVLLGGTSNSFGALKNNAGAVEARLADDSGLTLMTASGFNYGSSIQRAGVVVISATAPSAPSACGTSPAVTTANGTASWVVTGGTGGTATGCTITMPTATTGWNCSINNLTGSAAHRADKTTVQTASTTTSVTWEYQTVSTGAAVAFTASDVFRGICFAY